jgi:hypothetical protein
VVCVDAVLILQAVLFGGIWPDSFTGAAAPGGQAEGRGGGREWGVWMQS